MPTSTSSKPDSKSSSSSKSSTSQNSIKLSNSMGVNQVNPTTGNTDIATSNRANNIVNFDRKNNLPNRNSNNLDNIKRLNEIYNKSDSNDPNTNPSNIKDNQSTPNTLPNTPKINQPTTNQPSTPAPIIPPKSSFIQQLDSRRQELVDRLTQSPQKTPQPQPITPQTGVSLVSQRLKEANSIKKKLELARVTAWASGFLINAIIWGIISIFMLLILGAAFLFIINTGCEAVAQVPFGAFVPENIKQTCEYYNKLKGGCLAGQTESQKKADLPALECIGKIYKSSATSIPLYDSKFKVNVKKQVIQEIIKAGKTAGVQNDVIFYTIALHAGLSTTNDFKETSGESCLGIALICADGSDSSQWAIGTQGLGLKDKSEYLPKGDASDEKARVYQIKSIENIMNSRKKILDQKSKDYAPPACIKDKTEGKDIDYAIFYFWNNLKCDDVSPVEKVSKENFAKQMKLNLNAINCPDFTTELAFVQNYAYEDRAYIQWYEQLALIKKEEENKNKNFITVNAGRDTAIDATGKICKKLKEVRPFLKDAAKEFNNPLFPISEYLLGGMLMQETEMGFGGDHIPQGDCAGRGDGGKGHGLAQADSSSGDFYYADGSNVGFNGEGRSNSSIPDLDKTVLLKPKLTNPAVIKALGKSEFGPYKWFDCRENILYSAAHHIYLAELVQGYGTGGFDSKLKGWGLNPAKDSNGKYSDPKTYKAAIQLYIDGNNAGQSLYRAKTGRYCTADAAGNVSDACSSDGVYGKQVFEYAVNVAKCFGVNTTIEEIINNTAPGGGSSVDCNASGNLNAQGAEFPLLTKKGVKVYYSQPYPFYIGGTTSDYKHDGIDMSPGPTDPENTRAAAVVDGEITNVFLVSSISITGGDNCTLENGYAPCKKNQLLIELTENGTGKTFRYIHINPEKVKVKKGDKVTKGQELGIIDNFHFVHLHFEVRLNNVLQQPIEHIKGWNKDIQASNTRAESSVIDPALYQNFNKY
jgi:hypothetical protein